MSKRKRDDGDGTCNESHIKIESVISRILAEVNKWVDPCGCAYDTHHKVTREKDAATLRVGFFDSLTCKQICAVINTQLPGDYTIRNASVDMNKKTIVFCIQRHRDGAGSCVGTAQLNGLSTNNNSMDLMKLRISYNIANEDVKNVHHAINTLEGFLPNSTYKVSSKPASYAVVFTCKDVVTAGAISYGTALGGIVDIDHNQLVVDVKKTTPDILG
jgi:hypothetical protein